MRSVSRTLWSVISTPMPRSLRWKMIFWMSVTAMGVKMAEASGRFGDTTSAR